MSPSPPKSGLRARKRRATENAIELAAVDLALQSGVDRVTVEEICERADISRSTFFNYFPGRDYAIVGRAMTVLRGEPAAAVLASAAGDLPRGIFRLIFASIGHQKVNTEVARKRITLNSEQPAARRLTSIALLESSSSLIEVASAWLSEHPQFARLDSPTEEAQLAAAMAHAAIGMLLIEWSTGTGDISADESSLDRVFTAMRRVLCDPPSEVSGLDL
jgi:AcrR family transcriptional regulator